MATFKKNQNGFTLIEVVVAIGIFLIITVPIYLAYSNILDVIFKDQWRNDAMSLIQNDIEMIRNMPFDQIGVQGSYPVGVLLGTKTVNFQGTNFTLSTTVRNIDDPFDNLAPTDTSPGDYRLVEITATCATCPGLGSVTLDDYVASKSGLENTTNNGSLFINVFDANGHPIDQANVKVVNNSTTPTITINDTTNIQGVLQLIDIPTSTSAYQITVSKTGYTGDQTYPMGAPANPNPVKPHATVSKQQVTSISFAIDAVSSIKVKANDKMCVASPNIHFSLQGTNLIGQTPNVLGYSTTSLTGADGTKTMSNLRWDNYTLLNTDTNYDIAAYNSFNPIVLGTSTNVEADWLMTPKNPSALLVAVTDNTGHPIDNAHVHLTKTGYDQTLFTSRSSIMQTDWSGGNYLTQSGNIDADHVPGQLTLLATNNKYPTTTTEWLISKTYDFGTSNTTFYNIVWNPINQPTSTGSQSIGFQIATNNDNATWNFVGPDGTASTYYTTDVAQLNSIHNNNRYFRYKVFLQTADANSTPVLQDITFDFNSPCIPSGQAFFNGLANGTYTLIIQKSGFQTFTDNAVSVTSSWRGYKAQLNP